MARIGLNPYALAPVNSPDALVRAAQVQWVTAFPICLYGPAFVALARFFVTTLAPFGPLAQLDAFRVAACAAFLLCVPLAYGAFAGDRATRLRAAATIGLNPAAIWCAAEGHNDAIALAVVLAGFVLVRRRFVNAGGAVVALSSLIKPPGIAAAIVLAFVDRRARVGALAGIVVAVAFSWPLIARALQRNSHPTAATHRRPRCRRLRAAGAGRLVRRPRLSPSLSPGAASRTVAPARRKAGFGSESPRGCSFPTPTRGTASGSSRSPRSRRDPAPAAERSCSR